MRNFIDIVKLLETPIDNLELIGDFSKGSSFRKEQDRKLLTNPKAVQKIITKWQKVTENFNMYFINSTEAGKHTEVGEVSVKWLQTNMPKTFPLISIKDDCINVLFTNNKATPHEPMTAWMIAHRLSHVLSRYSNINNNYTRSQDYNELRNGIFSSISKILDYYGLHIGDTEDKFIKNQSNRYLSGQNISSSSIDKNKILKYFYQNIGTMRSARQGEIRDEFEFTHELFAQYIITGENKFNPPPRSFKAGNSGTFYFKGTTEDYRDCSDSLLTFARDLNYYFENVLSAAVGRIYVM